MRVAHAELESVSVYHQTRYHDTEKQDKERPDNYEERTWRNKLHVNTDGKVFIPPMAFKFALERAAQMLSQQVPGKGKATYTKHFKSGTLVPDPLILPLGPDDVSPVKLHLNADGKRGSGKRVLRYIPVIPSWKGAVTFYVLDDTITKDVFERHLDEAGKLVGIGQFRPENGGYAGRFKVNSVKWEEN